jgi:hypothetical protein
MTVRALYVGNGNPSTTSFHRFAAMQRIGIEADLLDPYAAMGDAVAGPIRSRLHYRTGYRLVQRHMQRWLDAELSSRRSPDLVWVDSGELLGLGSVGQLREFRVPVILYNLDDPTGGRDKGRFASLLQAVPSYDICISVRGETTQELYEYGAKRVLRVWRSYDEISHAPFADPAEIPGHLHSDVAFIGTWIRDEGRDIFLMELVDSGIDVAIWGDCWQKSPLWVKLKAHWKGPALAGRTYVGAIQGAKICIGLLSKGNRDLHTTRSLEIPYAGGLLCAERTKEHAELYKEGVDAVFWSNSTECAQNCRDLIENPERRRVVAASGAKRVRSLKLGNEDIVRYVLRDCGIMENDPLLARTFENSRQNAARGASC